MTATAGSPQASADSKRRLDWFDGARLLDSPFLDLVVGVALVVTGVAEVSYDNPRLLVSVLLATAPQVVRRRYPWFVVGVTAVGEAMTVAVAGNLSGLPVAAILSGLLSFYTLLRHLERKIAWLVAALAVPPLAFLLWTRLDLAAMSLAVVAGVAFAAEGRRSRGEISRVRADNLASLREQVAMAERARIAREMHDIVAHAISMIAVQAETAPYTIPDMSEPAKQGYAQIAATARETLAEMRRLLGVLRADAKPDPAFTPQPGLDLVPELLEQHRQADGRVDFDVVGERRPLPPTLDLTVYRIIQEALTNARTHAPGAHVSIELAFLPEALSLRIVDDGPGPAGDEGLGHGLAGMRERVLGLGGWFVAAPANEHGGFRIEAGLPLGDQA